MKSKTWWNQLWTWVPVIAFVLLAVPAFAQEEPDLTGRSLWDLVSAAAPVSYLLILLWTIGLSLTIENMVNIREEKLSPPQIVNEVETLIEEGEFDEALEVCKADDSYFARVAAAGLLAHGAGKEEVSNALAEASASETFGLNTKISYLSLIGNVGPIMGLLGTVTGMIRSFQVIESLKSPTPKDLARGIYEALVNTTLGLFTAICYLTVYFFMKNKVGSMTLRANLTAIDLLKRLGAGEEEGAEQYEEVQA